MTKSITLGLIAALSLSTSPALAEPVRIISTDNDQPFAFINDQKQPAGLYHSVIKEALAKIPGAEATIEVMPFRRGLAEVTEGKALGIYPVATENHGFEGVQSTSVPFLTEEIVTVCSDKLFDQTSGKNFPDDYKGLNIGRNVGGKGGGVVDNAATSGIFKLQESRDTQGGLKILFAGRSDCYITENLTFLIEVKAMATEVGFNPAEIPPFSVGTTIVKQNVGIGYGAAKSSNPAWMELAGKLDEALSDMKKSGRIDVLVAEFLR